MVINVRFFANLRETAGVAEDTVNANDVASALDVWKKSARGSEIPANIIIAVNMENVELDHPVKDGDKVAFFPPVTGG